MRTMATLSVVVAAAMLCFHAASAEQTQNDWLIGTWIGDLEGFGPNPSRTMTVTEVGSDGAVKGTWFITGRNSSPAQITVNGTQVKVVTGSKSVVDLKRQGESELAGSLVAPNGKTFPITLTRSSASAKPANVSKKQRVYDAFEVCKSRAPGVRLLSVEDSGRWRSDGAGSTSDNMAFTSCMGKETGSSVYMK